MFERLNFRDLGGLEVAGGLCMRPGVLFRSQGPGRFTVEQQTALAGIRLRLVCDLRSSRERAHAPCDWGGATSLIQLNLPDDFGDEGGLGRRMLRENPNESGARSAMRASYAAMPGALRPHLCSIIDAIVAGGVPLLIHCTAGKDRTGVLVALLLLLIGVPREAVVQDYLLSASFADRLRSSGGIAAAFSQMYGFALDQRTVDAVIGVDPEYLLAAIDRVEAEWGSVDSYFYSVGIDAVRREQLRSILTQRR